MSCLRGHSRYYFGSSSSSHISSLSTPSSLLTKGNHFLREQSVCGLEVQRSLFHVLDWRPQRPGLCGRTLGHAAPPIQSPLPYLSHLSHVQSSDFWHQLHKLGQTLQVKGTPPSPQDCPHYWHQPWALGSLGHLALLTNWLQIHRSHDAFRFDNIRGWLWKTLNTWLKFYHKECISQGYKTYNPDFLTQRTWARSWMQSFCVLFCVLRMPSPFRDIDVFTNQEVPLSVGIQRFYWGVIL